MLCTPTSDCIEQSLGKVIFSEACVKNSVHRGRGVLSQHALQVVFQHALQQVSRGVISQHALQVSRPTPKGEVEGDLARLGLQAYTQGKVEGDLVQVHTQMEVEWDLARGCLLPVGCACSLGGVPVPREGGGACSRGEVPAARGCLPRGTSPRWLQLRAVHILLECILVQTCFNNQGILKVKIFNV